MRYALILLVGIITGCAVQPGERQKPFSPLSIAVSPTKGGDTAEARYEVAGYPDPLSPQLWHDAHVVSRRSRVPVNSGESLETVPLAHYTPTSIAPLGRSEELAAEIDTQKKITAELRAMQAAMVETARKMESQYALLTRQIAETAKLRTQLQEQLLRNKGVSSDKGPVTPPAEAGNTEGKW